MPSNSQTCSHLPPGFWDTTSPIPLRPHWIILHVPHSRTLNPEFYCCPSVPSPSSLSHLGKQRHDPVAQARNHFIPSFPHLSHLIHQQVLLILPMQFTYPLLFLFAATTLIQVSQLWSDQRNSLQTNQFSKQQLKQSQKLQVGYMTSLTNGFSVPLK